MGNLPRDPRLLVLKSVKPNFLCLHGFQALGQDDAKGVDPSGKASLLFPKSTEEAFASASLQAQTLHKPSVLEHKRALKHHRDGTRF